MRRHLITLEREKRNLEEAARLLLAEFRNGKIGRFTLDEVSG